MTYLPSVLLVASSLLFSTLPYQSAAQAPTKRWDQSFGGNNRDILSSLQQTTDGGYVLGGSSFSPSGGDKTQPNQGNSDYWLVKVDASGRKQWDKTYGGIGSDDLYSLQQTTDGGYILGGKSDSGLNSDKTQPSQGSSDYWLVKVDANGSKQWDRTVGGRGFDQLNAVQQTPDGGYILGGFSESGLSGDKTQAGQGNTDYWLVKLDGNGTKQWDRTFGANNNDYLTTLQQTADGGFLMGGYSDSSLSGDKTQASQGQMDYWVVKVDAMGTKQWDRTLGGSERELLNVVQQTRDGGYLLGGYSASGQSGDKTQPSQGGLDYWIVKVDATGTKQWDKTYGGNGRDILYSLQQTTDGGYALGGASGSGLNGDKTQPSQGEQDYWVVKVDATGTKQWDQTMGGANDEVLVALHQTSEGGYLLGGYSDSGVSGDKTQPRRGNYDYWLVKLGGEPLATAAAALLTGIIAYPNPTTKTLYLRGAPGTPYHLLNHFGRVVGRGHLSAQPLDVEALPAGLYLLRDETSGRTSKLVKE